MQPRDRRLSLRGNLTVGERPARVDAGELAPPWPRHRSPPRSVTTHVRGPSSLRLVVTQAPSYTKSAASAATVDASIAAPINRVLINHLSRSAVAPLNHELTAQLPCHGDGPTRHPMVPFMIP
jgi:hypothetical protein